MIKHDIIESISTFTKIPVTKLDESTKLVDLVADSFVLVELVLTLQEDLGVCLSQEDLDNVRTISELCNVMTSLS